MPLHRELAVGLFDFILARLLADAEDLRQQQPAGSSTAAAARVRIARPTS
jgi:hypothetical protein